MTNNPPASALHCYAAYGWSFTPLRGKRPTLNAWASLPRESPDALAAWCNAGNVGLRTGRASGVIVIDLDTAKPAYDVAAVRALCLPRDTVTARTGTGGWHLYYRLAEGRPDIGNSAGKLAPCVDVRGNGGQVVFPGSIHPDTGKPYTWEPGHAPGEIALAQLPAALAALLAGPKGKTSNGPGVMPEATLPASGGISPPDSPSSPPAATAGGGCPTPAPPAAPPATPRGTAVSREAARADKFVAAALAGELAKIAAAMPGTRNATLNQCSFRLGQLVGGGIVDQATVEQALVNAVAAAGWDYDDDGRATSLATIQSGLKGGQAQPRLLPPPTHTPRPAAGASTSPAKAATPPPAAPAGQVGGPIAVPDLPPEPTGCGDDGLPGLGGRDDSGRVVLSKSKTLPTAIAYVREFHSLPEGRTLHCHGGRLLLWRDNRYVEIEEGALRQRLQGWLHNALQKRPGAKPGEWELVRFDSNPATVTAAAETITAYVHVPSAVEMPSWLSSAAKQPDPLEILSGKSGNLHIPTGEAIAATPDLFACAALDFDFDPAAPKPEEWLRFLGELWPSDPAAISLLQEWMGYCLTADTRQQKMLLIVGPRRSGKGTIGRILSELVGKEHVAGPTTGGLAGRFGLEDLLGKSLAVVSDARFSGQDMNVVVERLLCISGEDRITVERHYEKGVTVKLPTRFVFLSNEIPQLRDAAVALAGRFLVLTLRKTFYGEEDIGLTARLRAELPGILRWALEGWSRLYERGRFNSPESSRESERMLADLSSPVQAFLGEKCLLGPEYGITVDALFEAWNDWCKLDGRDKVGTKQGFGRQLAACVPGLVIRRNHALGRRYEGLCLANNIEMAIPAVPVTPGV